MTELDAALLVAAWLTGLAGGGGHCIGMCGGIVASLGMGRGRGWRGIARLAAAHAGRVLSYALAGAVSGFAGAAIVGGVLGASGLAGLRVVAAALVMAIGLQLVLGRPLLTPLERGGAKVWRRLAPLLRRVLPPKGPLEALAVGALWGWLPCGLVYAELSVAAASGGALTGGLVMASFGVGTVVSLSAFGAVLQALGLARLPRRASGVLLVLFGLWMLAPLAGLHRGSHGPADSASQRDGAEAVQPHAGETDAHVAHH